MIGCLAFKVPRLAHSRLLAVSCKKTVSTRTGHIIDTILAKYARYAHITTGLGSYTAILTEQAWPITRTHINCLVFLIRVLQRKTEHFFFMNIRCIHYWCPYLSASDQARPITRLVFLVVLYNSTHNIRNFFVMYITWIHCWCTCLSGPSLFFSCPMDFKAAEGWFVNVWNYNVIPYLHQALRSGRKVHYQALFILCSISVPFCSPRLIKFTSVTFVWRSVIHKWVNFSNLRDGIMSIFFPVRCFQFKWNCVS